MTTTSKTPYDGLDGSRFWRSGVADAEPGALEGLYRRKFEIAPTDRVATAGSCFAQHVARHMKKNGYNILDVETLPRFMPKPIAQRYGYGLYSARYGNVYTSRQLLQLVTDSATLTVRDEDIWTREGRYYDGIRPNVEPDGLDSHEEAVAHRRHHLGKVAELFSRTDVLVFTLGLTETWDNRATGTVYPTVPGLIAGDWDAERYRFLNLSYDDVIADMLAVREHLKRLNPSMRFILTVSPVPLTATASGDHVLVATNRSKAILRTVCATLADRFDDVDYFPSFDIITQPGARSRYYEPNLRSVTDEGVSTVMKVFFSEHPVQAEARANERDDAGRPNRRRQKSQDDVICEEALLDAFNR